MHYSVLNSGGQSRESEVHQQEGERSINPSKSRAATVPSCIKRHSASAPGGDSTCLQMREQTSAISNQHFLFLLRTRKLEIQLIVKIFNNANFDNYKMMH